MGSSKKQLFSLTINPYYYQVLSLFYLAVTTIFVLGIVMIYSTTSAEVMDLDLNKSTHQAVLKQILYGLMGAGVSFVAWKAGYQKILKYSPQLLTFLTFLLVLTLIPGIGREANGSRRWLMIFGLSFQPSEFVKLILPAYFIHSYLQFPHQSFTFRDFLKLIGTLAVPLFLILVEPNNGTTAAIGMTVLMLCLLMRISAKYWMIPLIACLFVGGLFAYNLSYVSARMKVYLNPELDLKGRGHQPYQAKIAAGSGRFLGRGAGNSLQKLSYLPEAQNDYIAAIYAEEFGFLGILLLIILYIVVTCLGFFIASRCQTMAGFYFGSALVFLIGLQAFLNLGVVSGLLPSTGLNLPFFSQGGSSLMANIVGLGIFLSIAQNLVQNPYSNPTCAL